MAEEPEKVRPGKRLEAELKFLSKHTSIFQEAVAEHNYLPSDFPVEQVQRVCSSISELHLGTAKTCYPILEHAIIRLSEIRSENFHFEEGSISNDQAPKLQRGDSLDQQLALLISAATTALDAYRRELRQEPEIRDEDWYINVSYPSLDQTTVKQDASSALERLRAFEQELEKDPKALGETLARRSADVRNSLRATDAELGSRPVIRKWLRLLSNLTKASAVAARATGVAVRKSLELGAPIYRRWNDMWSEFFEFGVDQAEKWAEEAISISQRLDQNAKRLKEAAEGQKERRLNGEIIRVNSSLIILGADGHPYPILEKTVGRMQLGDLVSFTATTDQSGRTVSSDLKLEPDLAFYGDEIITIRDIEERLTQKVDSALAGSEAVEMRGLYAQVTAPLRPVFRDYLFREHISFEQFVESLAKPKGYAFVRYGNYVLVAKSGWSPKMLSRDEFIDWSEAKVSALSKNGRSVSIGDLASELTKQFGAGVVRPTDLIVGVTKFSEPLRKSEKFSFSEDSVFIRLNANP